MSERNWQEDVDMMEGTDEFEWTNYQELQIQMGEALPYWLQEVKRLEAAIESLTEDPEVISMGEYQSLLDKYSTMARAYHDAQEEIKELKAQLAHANCEWQREKSMRYSAIAREGQEKRRADEAEAKLKEYKL